MIGFTWRQLVVTLVLVALLGCGETGGQAPRLTQAEFGSSWPFTTPEVTLFCPQPNVPLINTSDGYVALTGMGATTGARQLTADSPLWASDGSGNKIPLSAVIERALKLCANSV